jgi:hypothetical protein
LNGNCNSIRDPGLHASSTTTTQERQQFFKSAAVTLTTNRRKAAFFDAWEALGSTGALAEVWLYVEPAGVMAVAIPGYGITIGCSGMNVAGCADGAKPGGAAPGCCWAGGAVLGCRAGDASDC